MSCEPKSPHGPQISDALSSCRESASGRKIIDPLEEILLLVPCAVISGADGWTSIPLYGQKKLEFLRRFLPFEVTIQIPQRRSTHPELDFVQNRPRPQRPENFVCGDFVPCLLKGKNDSSEVPTISLLVATSDEGLWK